MTGVTSAVLFAWFVAFIAAGFESDLQRVAAVLIGASSAIFGGAAIDRVPTKRRRRKS